MPAPVQPSGRSTSLLRHKTVAIVGMGGLGAIAAQELAIAGVGHLRLFDADRIDLSNLHRQLLYSESDLGRQKVDAAIDILRRLASECDVVAQPIALAPDNSAQHLMGVDAVVDGTDRFSTKFWLNDVLVAAGIAFVHGGATGLRGQVLSVLPGRSACLRCVFPDSPNEADEAACATAGVLGPIANLVGALQSLETVRLLSDDPPKSSRLITYDGHRNRWHAAVAARVAGCSGCGTRTALAR